MVELRKTVDNLERKLTLTPAIPYIRYEKKHFEVGIENHECICFYCGDERNRDTLGEAKEKTFESSSEELLIKIKEVELLTVQKEELMDQIKSAKNEILFNRDALLNSGAYDLLQRQANDLLGDYNRLKVEYTNLSKERDDLIESTSAKIERVYKNEEEKREEINKLMRELKADLQLERSKTQELKTKVTYLEDQLDRRNKLNFNETFGILESQKGMLKNEVDNLKAILMTKAKELDTAKRAKEDCETKLQVALASLEESKRLNEMSNSSKEVEEMKQSLKSRKERLIQYEAKVKMLKDQLASEQNTTEEVMTQMDLCEKMISELNEKVYNLTNQLVEVERQCAGLKSEKMKDQLIQFGLEKDLCSEREKNRLLAGYVEELKQLLEQNNQENDSDLLTLKQKELVTAEDTVVFLDERARTLHNLVEVKERVIEGLKNEVDVQKSELLNLEKQLERTKTTLKSVEMVKGITSTRSGEIRTEVEALAAQVDYYKGKVLCKICKQQEKSVIVKSCFHTFCKECIEKTIENRSRRCPTCRNQLGNKDVCNFTYD